MLIQQQPAYVLHARPWRETSLLLECLTRDHGRVGIVARGVRRSRTRLSQSELQPFQARVVSFVLRGELGTLRAAEAAQQPIKLSGTPLLAGLYANELLVRFSVRLDPNPSLFHIYREVIGRLGTEPDAAWSLRRFERDLLQALGYAMPMTHEADSGEVLRPDADYRYIPEHGPSAANDSPGADVKGADLLALAADRKPDRDGMQRLRRLARTLIRHHLDGKGLQSWRVLSGVPETSDS